MKSQKFIVRKWFFMMRLAAPSVIAPHSEKSRKIVLWFASATQLNVINEVNIGSCCCTFSSAFFFSEIEIFSNSKKAIHNNQPSSKFSYGRSLCLPSRIFPFFSLDDLEYSTMRFICKCKYRYWTVPSIDQWWSRQFWWSVINLFSRLNERLISF